MMTRTPGSSKDVLKGLEGLPGKMEGNEIGLGEGRRQMILGVVRRRASSV